MHYMEKISPVLCAKFPETNITWLVLSLGLHIFLFFFLPVYSLHVQVQAFNEV